MRIHVSAVGQRLPAWAGAAVDDYLARLPKDFRVAMHAVRPEPRNGRDVGRARAAEAARLRASLPAGAHLVALDERGADWTTAQLAEALRAWREQGEEPAFLIGGADGLDAGLLRGARQRLRLSSLTLPHALARVVLVEQIYRAWSILAGHPYHRA